MSYTNNKFLDQNGNYDINKGYKSISSGNADKALQSISSQLDYIKNGRYIQSNRQDYLRDSHTDTFDEVAYRDRKNGSCFQKEEWICKRCYGKSFNFIGKIVDYQVSNL